MFDLITVKSRIMEVTVGIPQRKLAGELHMTQGNVSKMLKTEQMPQLDAIYYISEKYGVSADWLLGLSEVKEISAPKKETTYSTAVEAIVDMERCGNVIAENQKDGGIDIHLSDKLLVKLCKKGIALNDTDFDSYKMWVKEKLTEFDNLPLLWTGIWDDEVLSHYLDQAGTESEMARIGMEAKACEDELAESAE